MCNSFFLHLYLLLPFFQKAEIHSLSLCSFFCIFLLFTETCRLADTGLRVRVLRWTWFLPSWLSWTESSNTWRKQTAACLANALESCSSTGKYELLCKHSRAQSLSQPEVLSLKEQFWKTKKRMSDRHCRQKYLSHQPKHSKEGWNNIGLWEKRQKVEILLWRAKGINSCGWVVWACWRQGQSQGSRPGQHPPILSFIQGVWNFGKPHSIP